ncbi:MAG: tRNA (guanosine(37)-N1)-methyltransferase TrmD [Leptospiraceae bacterium]|nr:tRNA (guanosine(37)-N1)-methyltransferase TrmD [Leptospiraceae bacterium]
MQINVLTLFPDFFTSPLKVSLLGKAIDNEILQVNLINFRNYTENRHGKVDDAPYGGGSGMIIQVEPIANSLQKLETPGHVILLTPRAPLMKQADIVRLSAFENLTLICGHYEGFDERIAEELADESLCIGEFILSGGEPAALCLIDALARLQPGFMSNQNSIVQESFSKSEYIEFPQYTRPREFQGKRVPDVLLSGNHEAIERWREERSIEDYKRFRKL